MNQSGPLLIGIVGATGCGKTTLANRLVQRHGFTRVHMGQPIKDMLLALGLTSEDLNGPPEVRLWPSNLLGGKSPRKAMETLGTDWGRKMISPDIWSNAVELKIRSMWMERERPIVIDDLRFPGDWAVVQRLGGTLVRILRLGIGPQRTIVDRAAIAAPFLRPALLALGFHPLHETEFHWFDAPVDIELWNDTTPEELEVVLMSRLALLGISMPG